MATFMHRLCTPLRRFRGAAGGNVAITFGVAIIPIMGAVGAAVDFSHASALKAAMQAAVDATALGMSKMAAATFGNGGAAGQAALDTAATNYFNAVFHRGDVTPPKIKTTYSTSSGTTLTVTGTASMPTSFLGALQWAGMPASFNIGSSSTVTWGNSRLRVALALDNTGSMANSGKITALKTATKNLLAQLQAAAGTPGDVYVSIVPFSKDVSVDPVTNSAGTWIDWTEWNDHNGTCSKSTSRTTYSTKSACTSAGGTWTRAKHSTWNGCITDRGPLSTANPPASGATAYDENVAPPVAGTTQSFYPAEQYDFCPLHMKELGYDWTAMSSLVDLMYPNGSTNQPIGLVWGWQSLVGGGPFPPAPAMDANYKYQQVIILLSDGLNTLNRWDGDGSHTSTAVDARMYDATGAGTCKNIKDAGITIYAVQVNTDGAPTSTLLKNCASGADKFFLLTSATEIITTFDQIGTKLSQLRVAK